MTASPDQLDVFSHRRTDGSIWIAPCTAERNQWVLTQMEAWRKAVHAASQARSQGAKCRRWAEEATVQLDRLRAARLQQEAERHYQHAEALEQEALALRLALTARVV